MRLRARAPRGQLQCLSRIGIGPVIARDLGTDLIDAIEASTVDVTRLQAHDARSREFRHCIGFHATLMIDGHSGHPFPTETGECQRLQESRVRFFSDDDVHDRRAEQSFGFDIPSRLSLSVTSGRPTNMLSITRWLGPSCF